MTREQMEKITHAEILLLDVYWDIQDEKGHSKMAKRLDTILGKIYNLKYCEEVKK